LAVIETKLVASLGEQVPDPNRQLGVVHMAVLTVLELSYLIKLKLARRMHATTVWIPHG